MEHQKQEAVITVTGSEHPGVLQRLTEVVLQLGGNVEESRMACLGGQLAMIMSVSLMEAEIDNLTKKLGELEQQGFSIVVKPRAQKGPKLQKRYSFYELSVTGADHEGIIHHYANLLSPLGIHIVELESRVTPSPFTGAPLFSMRATIQVPIETVLRDLQERLAGIAEELSVEVDLKLAEIDVPVLSRSR